MPEIFIFVLVLVIGAPIAKAFAARIARAQPTLPPDVVQRLRQEIEATEQRAADADKRVAELEDRVDFLERLLQAPKSPPLVPPGGPPMSA